MSYYSDNITSNTEIESSLTSTPMYDGEQKMSYYSYDITSNTEIESSLISGPSQVSTEPLYGFINYDPFSHREGDRKSYWSSTVAIIRPSVALGFMCLPYVFQELGLFVAVPMCVLLGLLLYYSYAVMCRLRYKMCQISRMPFYRFHDLIRQSLSFGPSYCNSFSYFIKYWCILMFFIFAFGKSCVYTKYAWLELKIYLVNSELDAVIVYMILCCTFMALPSNCYIPMVYFFNEFIVVLLLATFVGTSAVFVVSSMFSKPDVVIGDATLANDDWMEILPGLGIIMFAYTSMPKVMKGEDDMDSPERFAGMKFSVLRVVMFKITNMFLVVGTLGYLSYYSKTKLGFSLLKVMSANASSNFFTSFFNVLKVLYAFYIASMHQGVFYETSLLFWTTPSECQKNLDDEVYWLTRFKIGMIWWSAVVAWFMDNRLERYMSLLGCQHLWNVMVFPYIVEMCLVHKVHGLSAKKWVITKDILFIVAGIIMFVAGLIASVAQFYQD